MSTHYVLKIQYVNKPPETRNIGARMTTIGREAGDIILGDPQSSGRHAEIYFENGNVRVKDLGSTNGTFFNGQRAIDFALQPGQGFSIGQTVMTLMTIQGAGQRAGAGKTMLAMGGAPVRPPASPPGAGAPPPPPGGFGGPPGPPPGGFGGPPPGPPGGPPPGGFGGPPPDSAPMGGPPPGGFGPSGGPPPGGPPPGGPPPGGPMGGPPPGGFGGPPPGGPPPGGPMGPPPGGGNFGGPPAPTGPGYMGPGTPPPVPQAVAESVDWMPGEVVNATLTADGFFVGANPLLKLIAAWNQFTTKITGGHIRVHVVVTNQRLLMIESQQKLCGFARSRGVNAIPLGSLAEAGWAKESQWFCIHTRSILIKSKTQTYNLVVKKIDDRTMREFMTNASGTITANALAGTAT